MKITKKTKERPTFENIKVDEWFIDSDGDIAMRLGDWVDINNNCIYFTRGGANLNRMEAEDYAYPVEVELVITDKR